MALLLFLGGLSCATTAQNPPLNGTSFILFKADIAINRGMALPVDVIYITPEDNVKEVTKVGPRTWFDSKERDGWPYKQTLMIRDGEDVLLKLDKPVQTKAIVIFASFFQVEDQKVQQVILDARAQERETIWVAVGALIH